ncbi:class I SAM-dependent methyltransferase [Muricoccus radiodurans]|uniref:class I SAM-dependent methyltransferase n=1 Tax=Muricoccus radiodurans TaxID=2231721 RepID=UPI003CF63D94
MTAPPCPITGDASPVLVQKLGRRFLHAMWRHVHGVAPTPLAASGPPIGLWRSACGLMFFHPPVAGDGDFYRAYYRSMDSYRHDRAAPERRPEFVETAEHLRPGDRVLDVGAGAGAGGLDRLLPAGATWQGLDPYLGQDVPGIVRETLEEHAAKHPAAYDAVCAFQVLEHVEHPRRFAEDMVACLKPGGLLVIGVPLWPSPFTEIPNFPLNAPPHHLTWWNPDALRSLAGVLGLEVVRAEALPPPGTVAAATLFWLRRLLPVRTSGGRYFAHRWSWWLSLLVAGTAARALLRLGNRQAPADAQSIDAYLVARKPPAPG